MNKATENKSKLLSISNNLMVPDVDKTLNYYNNLGFETVYKSTNNDIAYWAYIKKDNIELFLQSTTSLTEEFPELENQKNGAALTLWIRVENIVQWYEAIKNKADVIRPLAVTPYNGANEFVIQDINGFILHFSDFDLQKELNT
ncbi:VOC family protein [Flavicella marina]|uniref:VOC family protein n=1 Tax=Flavicella marina TaxID=1475951 RepID=UPI00126507FA|nr:VOC family protein [Flavicella marina]